MEYFFIINVVYYFFCFYFVKLSERPGVNVFIVEGFYVWKKVYDGENCVFLSYDIRKDFNLFYRADFKKCYDFMKPERYIDKMIEEQFCEEIKKKRL